MDVRPAPVPVVAAPLLKPLKTIIAIQEFFFLHFLFFDKGFWLKH